MSLNKPDLYTALSRVSRAPINDRATKRFVDLLDDEIGDIGTHVSDTITGVAPAASGVTKNITSISLTPGEWDVSGSAYFLQGTITFFQAGTSFTSATLQPGGLYYSTPSFSPSALSFPITTMRFSVPGPANKTVYLVANITYSAAPDSLGGVLSATKMG